MKKFLFTLFVLHLLNGSYAQSVPDSLMTEGAKLFERNDLAGAAKCFRDIVDNHKGFQYYNQCLYNLAYTYNELDSNELAIEWYEKIRASDVKDNERNGSRGIFEPYANYKHYATFNIATIEYNKGNYEKALAYYHQSLDTYPYYNTSGTDIRINKNTTLIYMTDCFKKLKRLDDALLTIVPEALDSDGSANYASVVNSAMTLINESFSRKQIADELTVALKTLNKQHQFKWRNTTIVLAFYSGDDFKASAFWTQLTKE